MFPLARFRVADSSMEPTLRAGDYVIVNRWAYRSRRPSVGDLVVLSHPREPALFLVKRVSALPDADGIFVVGDNPEASEDSREFGPVRLDRIVGRVCLELRA